MSITTASQQLERELARTSGTSSTTPAADTVSQQLVDKFQAMMAQANHQAQPVHVTERSDLVTKAVQEQADYYRQVPNDVLYMTQHMSALSMERLAAADMTIQLEIASLNADLQVKMATVQSSKDAVQTLMKNQ
jgi:type III secretion inner rod protein HrpB2